MASLIPFSEYQKKNHNLENVWLQYMCEGIFEISRSLAVGPITNPPGGDTTIINNNNPISLIDPRNTNWEYHYEVKPSQSLAIGSSPTKIYKSETDEYGTLLATSISTDNPDIRLVFKAWDPTNNYMQLDNTARELLALGRVISPTGLGLSLIRYDTAHQVYVIELRPPWPGLPFHKRLEVFAVNEAGTAQTLNSASIILTKVS